MANIVVIGAGVSGLTTALLLSKNPRYSVTIVAKHMPGDYDIEYTSPWAGANYQPYADSANSRWERNTWPQLYRLAKDVPEAGIHFQNNIVYNRSKDADTPVGKWFKELLSPDPWFKDLFPDFRTLPPKDLPPGTDSAVAFTSVCINTAIYLPHLVSQCVKNGVVLRRAVLHHVSEAAAHHPSGRKADVIVNCTGILASKLGGVMDKDVTAVRGQIVLVRNDPGVMLCVSGTDDADDELCYIMKRAVGGGTVLGGTYQKGNWDPEPSPEQAQRIMRRAVQICPQLTGGKSVEALDVIRHGVGLRPLRTSGLRLEKELIDGTWVVHNYGHSGWGYQASYGCAEGVMQLVDDIACEIAKHDCRQQT